MFGSCFGRGGEGLVGWNASSTDGYLMVDMDVSILDAATGAVVRTFVTGHRLLPMASDVWIPVPNLPNGTYVTKGVALFTGPGMHPTTATVYAHEGTCAR